MLGKLFAGVVLFLKNNKFVKTENIMPTVQKSNIELGLDDN